MTRKAETLKRCLGLVAVLVLTMSLLGACDESDSSSAPTKPSSTSGTLADTGSLEVRLHDAPAEVTAIIVEIDEVWIHQAIAEESQGDESTQQPNHEPVVQNDGEGTSPTTTSSQQTDGGNTNVTGNQNTQPPASTPEVADDGGETDALIADEMDAVDQGEWMPLAITGENPFNLLDYRGELNGESENILSKVTGLEAGKFTQIKMSFGQIDVFFDGDTEPVQVKLPSGYLKFVRHFEIRGGETTRLTFDILADKSFVFTGHDGQKTPGVIFKPVIKLDVSYEVDADQDWDNDGVTDDQDAFPFDATETADNDGDGTGDNADPDDDNDGVVDTTDNCPLSANAGQEDFDGDGIGDGCDTDDDNDSVTDDQDAFPFDPTETTDTDGDGTGDNADPDDDNDGVMDTADNCPLTSNPGQEDLDNDGIGDVCQS